MLLSRQEEERSHSETLIADMSLYSLNSQNINLKYYGGFIYRREYIKLQGKSIGLKELYLILLSDDI
jgi:hypothetical protein